MADDGTDLLDKANAYIAYGRLQEAAQVLREAIKREPRRAELWSRLAEIIRREPSLGSSSAAPAEAAANQPALREPPAGSPPAASFEGGGYGIAPAGADFKDEQPFKPRTDTPRYAGPYDLDLISTSRQLTLSGPLTVGILHCLFLVLDLTLAVYFFKEIGPEFWLDSSSPIVLVLLFSSLAPALLLATLTKTWLCKLSIHADGWVRKGIAAWRFPGPMTVTSWERDGYATGRSQFQLNYGSSSLLLAGCFPPEQTLDYADRITQWARQRMAGIPDADHPREPGSFDGGLLVLFFAYSAFSVLIVAPLGLVLGGFHYHFNTHAAPGAGAINAVVGFLVLALAAAIWRWAWLALREIKRGKVVWVLDALTVLLLVAAGAIIALRWGQLYDLHTRPAQEVTLTLRRPAFSVATEVTRRGGSLLYLSIDEPTLKRRVDYNIGAIDQCEYDDWRNAKVVEVRQLQNEQGVRILSVRRVDAE